MHDFGDLDHEHLADGMLLFKEIGRAAYGTVAAREITQLTSVGIDVGSATAHLVFSRLALRRRQEETASRYRVVHRETLARSPIALTPYADGNHIDAAALQAIFDAAFRDAGLTPETIDTGALIVTGAAASRANAAAIAALFADQGELRRGELGRHVGCKYWGPGRFGRALKAAVRQGRIAHPRRGVYGPL